MSNKAIFDIEPWQQDFLDTAVKYNGKGALMITGRGFGKSTFNRMWNDIMQRPVEELILSEGRVYGARYYCVEAIGGSWFEMEAWCTETFGSSTSSIWGESPVPEPGGRWYTNNRKFWFRTEKDRDWFILRWNS